MPWKESRAVDQHMCSARPYPIHIPELEYNREFLVRATNHSGDMSWHQGRVFISRILAGDRALSALVMLENDCIILKAYTHLRAEPRSCIDCLLADRVEFGC